MLETARAHKTANMELKLLDMNAMTFDAEFDVVFSNAALHWVLDHEKLLQTIYNALKPGGLLRAQFGGAGNVSSFIHVIGGVMELPEFVNWFEGFLWPWYMPTPEEYETLLSHTNFRIYRVWSENKDRYFQDAEALISMVEEAGLVPFNAVLPEDLKQFFRDMVIDRLVAETKQPDGRYFETFRRINICAEK